MSIKSLNFGYPSECKKCCTLQGNPKLQVSPYYKEGDSFRLILVGQDPTISKNPERVKQVLMLDQEKSQLSRWLNEIFQEKFKEITIYATNLIKCTFDKPPYTYGGKKFLKQFYSNCKGYLKTEIINYNPNLLSTLGESAHFLIRDLFNNSDEIKPKMKEEFNGVFKSVKISNVSFDYSPCLHIQTFRVANTYGKSVKKFKTSIINYIENEQKN